MFIPVKNLCVIIDNEVGYVNDAKVNHSNVSEAEYVKYMEDMKSNLNGRLFKLKSISCNKKLISKYQNIIDNLF